MPKHASITFSFDHFHFHPTARLVPDLCLTLCQTKIAERESFYHSDFCCVPHHLSFEKLLMETTKRKEVEGRTKRGCSCTWMIWRMMIATRRTRLIRISFSEDNKNKVWLTVWFFFHFSLPLEVPDKDFNINFLFKIYPYKYFVLNFLFSKV